MEQHPVPQNILEVEFKLFGSFTLKQFAKIVFGCVAAFLIFFLPLNVLIKFPLMGISVIVGLLLAIVPNFGTWLNGYLKALFISPRYVWIKSTKTPDILRNNAVTTKTQTQQQAAMQKQGKVDISEIPLDKIFQSSAPEDRPNDALEASGNLNQVYDQVFKKDIDKAKNAPAPKPVVKPVANQIQITKPPTQPEPEDSQGQIQNLKFELSRLAKDDPEYNKKESEIMGKINSLFGKLKGSDSTSQNIQSDIEEINAQGEVLNQPGQILFGIVVDKKDKPVTDATIIFKNLQTNKTYQIKTASDGKFSTVNQIPFGNYDISIAHNKFKFHTYRVAISSQKLPAYKFRER